MSDNCCLRDRVEHIVGYYFYSLLSRVKECMIAVVCCIDSYALRAIDVLMKPEAHALIFYSKLHGNYNSSRITLVELDNHYKHFLFDDWGAAKGTMNINYYELEAESTDELEIEFIKCSNTSECQVLPAVISKIVWALHSRPTAVNVIQNTVCWKIISKVAEGRDYRKMI